MAEESNHIIFNISEVPSPKAFLVSFPMNMYRVQTYKFEYDFDFFQKAVLMLKANPDVTKEMISEYLDWDLELIKQIVDNLQKKDFLDYSECLTTKGRKKLENIDSLTINTNEIELGHVFQFVDREDYYHYYVKEIGDEPNLADGSGIIVGTKGDGSDRVKKPFLLSFIGKDKKVLPPPNERKILDLIEKTSLKENLFENSPPNLSLKFCQDSKKPVPVTICTYIYLPKNENDAFFEPEWQILDPFGNGDSSQLKFYLESFNNPELLQEIEKRFGDAETINHKKQSDYYTALIDEVDRTIDNDFSLEFQGLDNNLQHYLKSAIKNMLIFRHSDYSDFDASDMFLLTTQRALETIFLLDEEKRPEIYKQMKDYFSNLIIHNDGKREKKGNEKEFNTRRYENLKCYIDYKYFEIKDVRLFLKFAKNDPNSAYSLKHYLGNLILTYNYDPHCPLLKLINGQIEDIIEIANKRNPQGHGKTESKGSIAKLTKEELDKFYTFLKNFINNYMDI